MTAGHFEKGKWVEPPRYAGFAITYGREVERIGNDTIAVTFDKKPEVGDRHFSTRTYCWYRYDGRGWVLETGTK